MAKPKKIKKKKSFMFTSRHPSDLGILSAFLAVASSVAMITCVMLSYAERGETADNLGMVGMFAFLSNIIGIISGMVGLKERDIYKWPVHLAIAFNILGLVGWVILIIWGLP